MANVQRTIWAPAFSWTDENGNPQTRFRGDLISIPQADADRGDAINAFIETHPDRNQPASLPVEEDATPLAEGEPVAEPVKRGPGRPRKSQESA